MKNMVLLCVGAMSFGVNAYPGQRCSRQEKLSVQQHVRTLLSVFSLGGAMVCLSKILDEDLVKSIQYVVNVDQANKNKIGYLLAALGFFSTAYILWVKSNVVPDENIQAGWQSEQDKENWAHPHFPYMPHGQKPSIKPNDNQPAPAPVVDNDEAPEDHMYNSMNNFN